MMLTRTISRPWISTLDSKSYQVFKSGSDVMVGQTGKQINRKERRDNKISHLIYKGDIIHEKCYS